MVGDLAKRVFEAFGLLSLQRAAGSGRRWRERGI
jgi:hypothetical protein